MSTQDIHDQLNDLYGIESNCLQKWSARSQTNSSRRSKNGSHAPELRIPVCIHGLHPLQSPEDGRIVSRAAYVVLGVTAEVIKEILSITVSTPIGYVKNLFCFILCLICSYMIRLSYSLCIPFFWEQYRHNMKRIYQSCNIRMSSVFKILLIPAI